MGRSHTIYMTVVILTLVGLASFCAGKSTARAKPVFIQMGHP